MNKSATLTGVTCLFAGVASMAAAATTSTTADVRALTAAESNVVAALHHYQDTGAWKNDFNKALAIQNADLAKVTADLIPPVPSGAFQLVTKTTATGEAAQAQIIDSDGPTNPVGVELIVTSTPAQAGVLTWVLSCIEGNDLSTANNQGEVAITFPVTKQLHMPVANPTSCNVVAIARLNTSGSVTIRLEEATK